MVYFVTTKWDGVIQAVKIGHSFKPTIRLGNLRSSNPGELSLEAVIEGAGSQEEAELHRRFGQHRIRGEWFRPGADLMEFIESIKPKPVPKQKLRKPTTKLRTDSTRVTLDLVKADY